MKTRSIEIALHVTLVFTCLVAINFPSFDFSIGVFSTGNFGFVWPSLLGTSINCIIFYGNSFFLIPKYLRLQKRYAYTVLLSIGFISLTGIEAIADYGLANAMGIDIDGKGGWSEIIILVVVVNMLTLLASFAYRFSKDWFYHEHLQGKLKEEKLAAELAFLKSQVNPHFLFNTLNNLFASAIQHNDEVTAAGIRKLAGLMRYMLHESNSEYIALSKELEYINNYIELQRLRLGNQEGSTIAMKVIGKPDTIRISPMLFIPFIENAFKHGVSMSSASPIDIQVSLSEKEIHFSVTNSVNKLRKADPGEASGVGLENVIQRLNLLYPNRHTLEINATENQFIVKLTLQLT